MSEINISTRYAQALMNLAVEKDSLEKISEDINLIEKTFSGSRELQLILINPVIKQDKKLSIITELFIDKVSKDTYEFLKFVLHKNRENLLYKILKQFSVLRDRKFNIINAIVISSYEMLDNQKKDLVAKLESYTKKKVLITYDLDRNLIGGFTIKMDDTVIDASLKRQLELLKIKFLQGSVRVN